MYPGKHAAESPHKVAAILADTGESLTYGELESNSVRLAHVLHEAGLRRGDVVALLTDNSLRAFDVYWAAMRSGLYITVVNHNLAPDEVSYIVNDSGARALVVSAAKAELAAAVVRHIDGEPLKLAFGGPIAGYGSYEDAVAAASDEPFADQPRGMPMLYSSGTTGRPKGVRPMLPEDQLPDGVNMLAGIMGQMFAVGPGSVYLSPAPSTTPRRWAGPAASRRWVGRSCYSRSSTRAPAWRPSNGSGSPMPSSCRPCSCACCSLPKAIGPSGTSPRCVWRSTRRRRARSRSSRR